ncbi:MAG TPA: hypothetical protein VFR13_00620 [Jiangellaceae bacterium]|nr:hypothetical protein [Jiangellaceae bacterium]
MSMTDNYGASGAEASIPLRDLALLCGDVHAEVLRQMPQLSTLSDDELMQRATADLAKLRSRELLTDTEKEQLLDILHVIRAEASPQEKSEDVDKTLQQIKTSLGSPAALAIAAIAADSSRSLAKRTEEASLAEVSGEDVAVTAADVVGGIAGVLIGDELCGLPCGILGGAAGAAGASLLAQKILR